MKENRLLIAAAGAGKTSYIVQCAVSRPSRRAVVLTFTDANERQIISKFIELHGAVPPGVTVMTWFSFLLMHGAKPFQGTITDQSIGGLLLVNERSGIKYRRGRRSVYYAEDKDLHRHYFSPTGQIYSDKLAKFVCRCEAKSHGAVLKRIGDIFDDVYIDEVQDLAGYDLELIKLLFQSRCSVTLVGDPRQTTYLTHHEAKYKKYSQGGIRAFIQNEVLKVAPVEIDDVSLRVSHRNNSHITKLSSQLYPAMTAAEACSCPGCRAGCSVHLGVFLVKTADAATYLSTFKPVQLRWDSRAAVDSSHPVLNFGESKGWGFDRVMLYPTKDMERWVFDKSKALKETVRSKFYVAITRARYSVAIVVSSENSACDLAHWTP